MSNKAPDGFVTLEQLGEKLEKIPGMKEKIERTRQPAWMGAVRGLAVLAFAIPLIIFIIAALKSFGLITP